MNFQGGLKRKNYNEKKKLINKVIIMAINK